jgi:hypothetical protein
MRRAMAEEVHMALRNDGRARTPGPMGDDPGGVGARRPGPLRFAWWLLADTAVTTAVMTRKMPKPAPDGNTKVARIVPWSLGKDKPAPGDVKQQVLANCQAAAILAALANTASGRPRISALVAEHSGAFVTDLSDVIGELAERPKEGNKEVKTITSNRYFTVTLDRGSEEVSDVFYTDDADEGTWSMIYMDSPNKPPNQHLWPCVIEKGYAALMGYDYNQLNTIEIDGQKPHLPAEEVWKDLVGKPPDPNIRLINQDTDLLKIAKAASDIPTIAASNNNSTKVTSWHAHTVLGLSGSAILLYDPDKGKIPPLSLQDFRSNFFAILSGNP